MYKTLGVLNVILLSIIVLPYILRVLNTKFMHIKKPWFNKLMKKLRFWHKILAVVFLVSVLVHGWLALGALRLHTGSIAAAAFFITALFGLLFFILKKRKLLQTHRIVALISVVLAAVHLIIPSAVSWFM